MHVSFIALSCIVKQLTASISLDNIYIYIHEGQERAANAAYRKKKHAFHAAAMQHTHR